MPKHGLGIAALQNPIGGGIAFRLVPPDQRQTLAAVVFDDFRIILGAIGGLLHLHQSPSNDILSDLIGDPKAHVGFAAR